MINNETTFMKLANMYFKSGKDENFSLSIFLEIFERGYKINSEDEQYVWNLYKKTRNQDDLIKWSIIRFIQKLNNPEQIKLTLKLQNTKILFVILSYKLGKPINYNFPNLLGVSNNAIQHYKKSGDIILKAMETYGQTQKIKTLDLKKGTFKRKLNEYNKNKPAQDKDFEDVVKKLFKELG